MSYILGVILSLVCIGMAIYGQIKDALEFKIIWVFILKKSALFIADHNSANKNENTSLMAELIDIIANIF